MAEGDIHKTTGIYSSSCSTHEQQMKFGTVTVEVREGKSYTFKFAGIQIRSRIGDQINLTDIDAIEGLHMVLGNVIEIARRNVKPIGRDLTGSTEG